MSQEAGFSASADHEVHLRTGEEYRESMRDGRTVYYGGKKIDVTEHYATAGVIDLHARIFDAQHDDATRDILTYEDADGVRRPTGWLIPTTAEHLRMKREYNEYFAFQTLGIPGRSPDTCHWTMLGILSVRDEFERLSPAFAPNIAKNIARLSAKNSHLTCSIGEPQGTRSRASKAGEDRDDMFRIVRENDDGIWLSGARTAGSSGPQCDEIAVGTIYYPFVQEAESVWVTIQANAPGLSFVCRET